MLGGFLSRGGYRRWEGWKRVEGGEEVGGGDGEVVRRWGLGVGRVGEVGNGGK